MTHHIPLALAAILNACMDRNFNDYKGSIFSTSQSDFWNPSVSWRFKWADPDTKTKEKFFGSTTFLVFLTDSWHLFKMLFLLNVFLTIYTYKPVFGVWDLPIMAAEWGIIFEISYRLLKKR